jgi:hypothetical protein
MATRTSKSIIGDFRGKLGPLVLTESFGEGVARSMPSKPGRKKALTGDRKKHTTAFGMVNSRLRSATQVFNLGFPQPKKPKMSAFNAAVSWHFDNAVSGDPEHPVLDMEKLKFSSPIKKTQKAWEAGMSVDDENTVTITWKLNPSPHKCTRLDDRAVIVMFYEKGKRSNCIYFDKKAKRRDLTFSWKLAQWQKGHDVYWYMFMISADKKLVSDTQYLGKVTF